MPCYFLADNLALENYPSKVALVEHLSVLSVSVLRLHLLWGRDMVFPHSSGTTNHYGARHCQKQRDQESRN